MLKVFSLVLCAAVAAYAIQTDVQSADDDFQLPPGTITCQIDSPDRDECIKEAVQDMLPKLKDGNEALNIPPLDPMLIEQRSIGFKQSQLLHATGTVRKMRLIGCTDAIVNYFKTNITRKHISAEIKTTVPRVYAEGLYRAEGRFNALKMKSKGYFNVTATDLVVITKTFGNIEVRNGKEYLRATSVDFEPTVGDLKVYATGLFPDPELNRVTLEFFNQYWPFMYRELLPETKEIWEPYFLAEANKFLLHVPLRKLLYYGDESA